MIESYRVSINFIIYVMRARMRIFIASDIHFEFHDRDWLPELPTRNDCDIIILAGDISSGSNTIFSIEKIWNAKKVPIIWIAGNHEYYHQNHGVQENAYR